MPLAVALVGDQTNPLYGPPGEVESEVASVIIEGRPVATIGSMVATHGNPTNPHAPGFNPSCSAAVVISGIPNILVEGRPIATLTSKCSCGFHFVQLTGATSVMVGE